VSAVAEHKPAAVGLAQHTFDEISMLSRAIVALLDGPCEDEVPLDQEALDFIRKRAALGRPDERLAKFIEEREAQRREAFNRVPDLIDAHPEQTRMREEKYAAMMAEGKLRHWREY
jgi:hypothetical protein